MVELGRALMADLDQLTEDLVDTILREDPSYGPGRLTPGDLRHSCRTNLEHVLGTLVGDHDPADADTLAPPRATGSRRAEQGVPLGAVLHAYRLGFRTIWEAMVARARGSRDGVEALVDAASEVWDVVDVFSTAVADAYRTTELALARRGDRQREALLDALLDGRGRERTTASDAAASLDLPEHGRYAVVVLEGTEHGMPARSALGVAGLRSAWRSRADDEVGLVLLTAEQRPRDVRDALRALPGARGGVSPAVIGLAEADDGHRAALTALRAVTRHEQAVVELDERLPAALLVTAPDLSARLVQRALGGVLALAEDEQGLLLDTLRTWLATGGAAGQTASRLYCHRNTVLNRMRRLEALTGRSAERVDDLVEWSLALLALDVLGPEGTPRPHRPLG